MTACRLTASGPPGGGLAGRPGEPRPEPAATSLRGQPPARAQQVESPPEGGAIGPVFRAYALCLSYAYALAAGSSAQGQLCNKETAPRRPVGPGPPTSS
eukprot:SM000412S15626  [mRNA]  locus=s412:28103:28852:+ [translate_table: standard]